MTFETAKTAIDTFLSVPADTHHIGFFGGEPLLAWHVVSQTVRYAERRATPLHHVTFGVTTNGMLLDRARIDFLIRKRFEIYLSFHTHPGESISAGGIRFRNLDSGITAIAGAGSGAVERLYVQVVVTPANVAHLAELYFYLCEKGVNRVSFEGDISKRQEVDKSFLDILEHQFGIIFDESYRRFRLGERAPLTGLSDEMEVDYMKDIHSWDDEYKCTVLSPDWKVVDVDGGLYSCPLLIDGLVRTSRAGPLPEDMDGLRIGTIHDASTLVDRRVYLTALKEKIGAYLKGLVVRGGMHGFCRECEYGRNCFVCPMCLILEPNMPVPRVPDHLCHLRWLLGRFRVDWRKLVASPAQVNKPTSGKGG